MSAHTSRIRSAWNATLVTHASAEDLDKLAKFYGLGRPSFISRTAWRRALIAGALAYRGTPNITQFFLEGALADYSVTISVKLDPSRPTQLFSPGGEFTQDLIGRLVRLTDYGLFRVIGPADIDTYSGEVVDLEPHGTSQWQAPDWSQLDAIETADAEFLAFDIREDQVGPSSQTIGDTTGTTTVYVFSSELEGVPATFIQSGAEYAIASVNSGTETVTTTESHDFDDDDEVTIYPGTGKPVTAVFTATGIVTTDGPHNFSNDAEINVYPGSGGVQPGGLVAVTTYYAIVVSENELSFSLSPGGSAETISSTGTLPLFVAPVAAGRPAGVIPTGWSASSRYYAIVVSPTELRFSLTAGGAAEPISNAGTLPLYVAPLRPLGQRSGGIIMEDAYASGSEDPAAGPYPLFLASDETLGSLSDVCKNMLNAWCKIRFVYVPPWADV